MEIAHRELDQALTVPSCPYSAILDESNQLQPRQKRPELINNYKTTGSFFKINGRIIRGEGKIGKGAFGTTKYVADEHGALFAMKIEKEENKFQKSEITILDDLNLLAGKSKRADKDKYYTQMSYLGTTLSKIIDVIRDIVSS